MEEREVAFLSDLQNKQDKKRNLNISKNEDQRNVLIKKRKPNDINQKKEGLLITQKKNVKSKNTQIKSCISNAERCRNYRQRRKINRTNLSTTINDNIKVNNVVIVENTPSKNALNCRRYREKKARNELVNIYFFLPYIALERGEPKFSKAYKICQKY